jgi:biopolymer transport protein ExbD
MKKKRSHKRKHSAEVNLGFQIAPMIDVVFVILLFFIVQAGDIQVENSHVTQLPGSVESPTAVELPDEVSIVVEDDGQIYMNEEPMDEPGSKNLPQLASSLNGLREASEATKTKVLVTIYANELAKYERVVDVLDALTRAQINNVTFQAGAPE